MTGRHRVSGTIVRRRRLLVVAAILVAIGAMVQSLAAMEIVGTITAIGWWGCALLTVLLLVMADLRETHELLYQAAVTDPLTGIHNRRYLEQRLVEEMSRAKRYERPFSCLYLDLDHFSEVNRLYRHTGGDRVLRQFTMEVEDCLRDSDVFARVGGEEFVALLPETGADEAMVVAERIRAHVEGLAWRGLPRDARITVSVGVAAVDHAAPGDAEGLLDRADLAMYSAKEAGRNRVGVGTGLASTEPSGIVPLHGVSGGRIQGSGPGDPPRSARKVR